MCSSVVASPASSVKQLAPIFLLSGASKLCCTRSESEDVPAESCASITTSPPALVSSAAFSTIRLPLISSSTAFAAPGGRPENRSRVFFGLKSKYCRKKSPGELCADQAADILQREFLALPSSSSRESSCCGRSPRRS